MILFANANGPPGANRLKRELGLHLAVKPSPVFGTSRFSRQPGPDQADLQSSAEQRQWRESRAFTGILFSGIALTGNLPALPARQPYCNRSHSKDMDPSGFQCFFLGQ